MQPLNLLENLSHGLFWDVDREKIEARVHAHFIIRRVMDRGTREDVRNVRSFYAEDTIREALVTARNLDPKTIHFFSATLDIPLEDFRAIKEPAKCWEPAC